MQIFSKVYSRVIASFVCVFFSVNMLLMPVSYGQLAFLPTPGTMVGLTAKYYPLLIKGMKLYPDNPFKFDFILDLGDDYKSQDDIKVEGQKLASYFLAAMTTPEKEMWVNLSPYENSRIISKSFGDTEMGKEILAQDYILKQIMATALYPERQLGKEFWQKVYSEASRRFGTSNVPVSAFNKVWILPDKASVYENSKTNSVLIVDSTLKVMLEQDYLAANKSKAVEQYGLTTPAVKSATAVNAMSSAIIKEIVIPALEKEVNTGKNFSKLRQVYQSLILATWYKHNLKESILTKLYADHSKTLGVNIDDKTVIQKIYQQYLNAYKKGVYNFIKEEKDPLSNQTIPRKYFSGGLQLIIPGGVQRAMTSSGQRVSRTMVSPAMLTVEAGIIGSVRLSNENDPAVQKQVLRLIAKSRIIKSNPRTQVEKTTMDQLMADVYKRLTRDAEVFPLYPVLGRQNVSPVVYVLVDENRPEGTFETTLKNGNNTTIVVVNNLNNIDDRLKALKGVDQVPFYIALQYVPFNFMRLRWLVLLLPLMLASSIGLNTPSYMPPIVFQPTDKGLNDNKPKDNGLKDDGSNNNRSKDNGLRDNVSNNNKPKDNGLKDNGSNNNKPKDNGSKDNESNNNKPKDNGLKDNGSNDNKPKDKGLRDNGSNDNKPKDNVPTTDWIFFPRNWFDDARPLKPEERILVTTSIGPRGVYDAVARKLRELYPQFRSRIGTGTARGLVDAGNVFVNGTVLNRISADDLNYWLSNDPLRPIFYSTHSLMIDLTGFNPDKASTSTLEDVKGGIDLEKINIDATRQGMGVRTAFNDPVMLKMLQNAQGLKAVVTDLKPLTMPMVNMILGFNDVQAPIKNADSNTNKTYVPKTAWIDQKLRKLLV